MGWGGPGLFWGEKNTRAGKTPKFGTRDPYPRDPSDMAQARGPGNFKNPGVWGPGRGRI